MPNFLIKLLQHKKLTISFILFSLLSTGSFAQEQQPFAEWLADLRNEALAEGISENLLDEALSTIEEPIPRVIELDQSQPEFVQTFSNYMNNRLSQAA